VVLSLVSRIDPRKGTKMAVEAFAEVLKKVPEAILLFVFPINSESDRYYFWEVYKTAEQLEILPQVKFLSGFQGKDLAVVYQASDGVLMPSLFMENCPLVCLEAFACGTPVIGTSIGGLPELIKPLDKKLISKTTKPKAFARTIVNFLSLSKKEKNRLRRQAVKLTQDKFSQAEFGKKLLRAFEEVLQEKA